MKAKTVTLDFGKVHPLSGEDIDKLVRAIERNIQLNVNEILAGNCYRFGGNGVIPMQLKVTVSLQEVNSPCGG